MKAFWQLLAALWPDDATTANLPAEGAAGTWVATLDTTTRIASWQQASGSAEILVDDASGEILIDAHGGPVAEPVWALFAEAARLSPAAPGLIEWDSDLPPFSVLIDEARAADRRRGAAMMGVAPDAQVA